MTHKPSRFLIIFAWISLLLASELPRIILQEIFQYRVSFNLSSLVAAVVVLIGLALTFFWAELRSLRPFFLLFLGLVGAQWIVFRKIAQSTTYQAWLAHPAFQISMLANQSLRLLVTLIMIGMLFVLRKRPNKFFLIPGDAQAEAEPVAWLGIHPGERWDRIGRKFAFLLSLGTLTFLVIAGRPSLNQLVHAWPFLPFVILAAALNAFNEEMTYKASFLSVLEEHLGKTQALLLMATYFGIGHFYGIPFGVIGVLMAGFLGWFLGKSMLETRGLFWAWFIHFWQDVLIFAFLAIGSITPGGG